MYKVLLDETKQHFFQDFDSAFTFFNKEIRAGHWSKVTLFKDSQRIQEWDIEGGLITLPAIIMRESHNSTYKRPKCKRGDVFIADMSPGLGSEQYGFRPVVIVSNDMNNKHSPTVNVCVITTEKKKKIPVHVFVPKEKSCLIQDSTILVEQCRVIDKLRLLEYLGRFSPEVMKEIDEKLKIQFALN